MFKDAAPGNQEVLVFEEQCLCDNVFVALQPVQSALIDDVPHDHVCVLKRRKKTKKGKSIIAINLLNQRNHPICKPGTKTHP